MYTIWVDQNSFIFIFHKCCTSKRIFQSLCGYGCLGHAVLSYPYFLAVLDYTQVSSVLHTCSLRSTDTISLLLGQKALLCTGDWESPQSQSQHLCIFNAAIARGLGCWKKKHFHGWTHMLLLDWQAFSIWIHLWRFINHWKYLNEVDEQTPILLNESWVFILKIYQISWAIYSSSVRHDGDRDRTKLISISYGCFQASNSEGFLCSMALAFAILFMKENN